MKTMEGTLQLLEDLLRSGSEHLLRSNGSELEHRPAARKWSKKEILGHLIDSAINNLQRFTEIQYTPGPYRIRPYKQVESVEANDYQQAEVEELVALWLALNARIIAVVVRNTEETLRYPIELEEGVRTDQRFLITDYVDHLEHHVRQLLA